MIFFSKDYGSCIRKIKRKEIEIDEKNKLLIAKNCLISGIKLTDSEMFLNDYMLVDLLQSEIQEKENLDNFITLKKVRK